MHYGEQDCICDETVNWQNSRSACRCEDVVNGEDSRMMM